MGTNIKDQRLVARYRIHGLEFDVERITWTNSDGLSYDVTETATGFRLHDESFDTQPSREQVEQLIAQLRQTVLDDTLDSFFDRREVLEFLFRLQPRVQLVHERDPDYECGIVVFLDGQRLMGDVTIEDIDPGRGYDKKRIAERRQEAREAAEAPDATDYDLWVAQALEEAPFDKWALG